MLRVYQEATARTEEYQYDAAGNRKLLKVSLVQTAEYTSQYYTNTDRLKTDGRYAFVYDNAGNMVKKGNTYTISGDTVSFTTSGGDVEYWEYKYDLLNRLIEVTKNGNIVSEYAYDPEGLRVVKKAKGETTHYVFQGTEPIFEKKIGTGKIKSFVYALGKHLARVDGAIGDTGAKKYWYVTDHLGSIRAVSDADGKVVWKADYLAFGTQFGKNADTDFEELHSFTGKEYDPDTGLHYYNARWYDAELGRFVSEDPVGDPNSPNLFSYSGNNPLKRIDPSGLSWEDTWAAEDEADADYDGYLYGDPTVTAPQVEGVTVTFTENSDGSTTQTITTKKETGIDGITGISSYSYTFRSDGKVIMESEHITFINQDGQTITVITTNNYDKVTQTYTFYDKEGNVVDSSTNVYDYKAGESPLYSFENPGGGRLKSKEEGKQKLMFSIKGMDKTYQLDYRVAFAYLSMVSEARIYGIDAPSLGLWSAYRSDKRQKELWDDRVKELLKDPKWAAIALVDKKAFEREVARGVARPGTGPHRTGRAVDLYISSKYLNKLDNAARFRQEEAFQWLNENASKYGFYNYYEEPWHWEYNPKSL